VCNFLWYRPRFTICNKKLPAGHIGASLCLDAYIAFFCWFKLCAKWASKNFNQFSHWNIEYGIFIEILTKLFLCLSNAAASNYWSWTLPPSRRKMRQITINIGGSICGSAIEIIIGLIFMNLTFLSGSIKSTKIFNASLIIKRHNICIHCKALFLKKTRPHYLVTFHSFHWLCLDW
jgi:hypothetical protein